MAASVKATYGVEEVIEITNGTDAQVVGEMVAFGNIVGIHKHAQAASATQCPIIIGGVKIRYTKLTTDVVTAGALMYFDAGNDRLTVTASTHKLAGIAAAAAGSTETTCDIYLGVVRLNA